MHIEHLDARYLMANGDESFDGVTAPALPVGWTQSTTSTNPWTTVSGGSDTAPNHAFVANLGNTADSALTSPSFLLTQTNGRLSFKHAYDSETDWDGGVLEISVNAGAFTDIVTSGGTFISGGYDSPLFSGSGNPLANRAAWYRIGYFLRSVPFA